MCKQSNAQNPSSQASAVPELRTSTCLSWIQKRQRNQRPNCQHPLDHKKKQGDSKKTSTSASLTTLKTLTVGSQQTGKFLEMGIPDHLTYLLRNLYAGQAATVRMGHGTMDWFQSGKEYVKALYYHPAYLIYMESTSCEMLSCLGLSQLFFFF